LIRDWLGNRNTIKFLGIWEQLINVGFKPVEFDGFKKKAGLNSFTSNPKPWPASTGAIGLIYKAGHYGRTYALKEQEFAQLSWDIRRNLAKVNYQIHTDSTKENVIPDTLSKQQISIVYASEGDLMNVALFGSTAQQWRDANPSLKGNMRDHANMHQLVCLASMESMTAHFIVEGLSQSERLQKLNALAVSQMTIIVGASAGKLLGTLSLLWS
jgi:hypothetical protein